MGAQISTNLSSGCRYLNLKSKADLGRYIKHANKSTLMVINFTATWCQPCIDAEPPMRKLAEEFPDVKFARVDIDLLQNDHANAPLEAVSGDDSQDVVKEFELKTMPTFLLCKKVDDGLDKGKGAAEVGGGNRISSSVVPSAIEEKRTTSIKGGNSVVPSATEGKSADSVTEGNKAAAGATGGKRAVNYKGKKVFIDEIYRMEGPLEGHELRKKIEYYKIQHTTASFKSTDEICSYLKKSKPTQLMVLNFTTEWCEPCKKADKPFKKLSKHYEDVKFAKVDVDVLMNIAKELDVKMMPTFLLVKVKKLEKEHVKKDGEQEDRKDKKDPPEKEHVKKDGEQEDHEDKKDPPEKEHVKKDGEQEDHKDKKDPPEKEHVKKDGEQDHKDKKDPPEKEHVKKDGEQEDHKDKKDPLEKEHVKKDGKEEGHKDKKEPPKDAVRGDHKDKKGPLEKENVKMVKLAQVVGWNTKKERELTEMIKKHRYTTT